MAFDVRANAIGSAAFVKHMRGCERDRFGRIVERVQEQTIGALVVKIGNGKN